jgi:hypothetical protein
MSHRKAAAVLFGVGPGGRRFFKNAGELAVEIARLRPEYKKSKSLASFLHQILEGDRHCPAALQEGIQDALRSRLAGESESVRNQWLHRFVSAMHARLPEPADARDTFDEVLVRARAAQEHFIITTRPAEQERHNPEAETLSAVLQERLGLLTETGVIPSDAPRYTFCLPSREKIIEFWRSVFRDIQSKTGLPASEVESRLCAVNKEHLRVYQVPTILCGCPLVVFEPSSDAVGFNLYYHATALGGIEVSVARLDKDYVADWKSFVFYPFRDGDIETLQVQYSR